MSMLDLLAKKGIEKDPSRSETNPKKPDLLTQTEARQLSAKLNETWSVESTGMCHVAHPVPISSWGGQEHGWSVSLASIRPKPSRSAAPGRRATVAEA